MSPVPEKRHIPDRLGTSVTRLFASWEALLVAVAVVTLFALSGR